MGEFSADWLSLREPADTAARSARLTQAVAARFALDAGLTVLDLGCGTGSNVRHLAPHLHPRQHWLLADRDPVLLAEVRPRLRRWADARDLSVAPDEDAWRVEGEGLALTFVTNVIDLADLSSCEAFFADRRLVTAAALLDLVSATWLEALASVCRQTGAAGLFALSYDGRILCSPREDGDDEIRELVNRHQTTDKGFGPALGPAATDVAAQCFGALGYSIDRETSDWHLGPDEAELQRQLVAGWGGAAMAMAPARAEAIADWQTRRLAQVAAGRSRLVVGHEDLAVWLPSA